MPKPSHRHKLLDAGLRVMFRQGYNGSGVRAIVDEAKIPQGCFTNHFRSKEVFAREVLDRYFCHVKELVGQALSDAKRSPRERLLRYLDIITDRLTAERCTRGCLIGDFSLEATQHSELLRERLGEIFLEWRKPFVDCIAEAQKIGEIAAVFNPEDLAEFFLCSWEGAILRMKVERTPMALERFKKIVFQSVFKKEGTERKLT